MKIRELSISNCLSFGELGLLGGKKDDPLVLKDFNLFIGPNNAGKSNVLRLFHLLQLMFVGIRQSGGPGLANIPLPPEIQPFELWVFGKQTATRKIDVSFTLEIEEADNPISDFIGAYDAKTDYTNPVRFLLALRGSYPKSIQVRSILEQGPGSPIMTIRRFHVANDDPHYDSHPLLDREGQAALGLVTRGPRQVWTPDRYNSDTWDRVLLAVGAPIIDFLNRVQDSIFPLVVKKIPAVRKIKAEADDVIESLHRLQNGTSAQRKVYRQIVDSLGHLAYASESDLDLVYPDDTGRHGLNIEVGGLQLPLDHLGSGVEQLLSVIAEVVRHGSNKIVLMEEPEAHLHPRLQRELISFFKKVQDDLQHQYLITTHSSVFLDDFWDGGDGVFHVDSVRPTSGGQPYSSVTPVQREDGQDVFRSLGVRPSDLLFANGILVVEGKTDKLVYSTWARTIGKAFEDRGILVIDAEGAGNIHKYLESDVIKRTCFTCLAICDKNAEKELRRQFKGIVAKDQFRVLAKGDLEDYYPRQIVLDFARELGLKRGLPEKDIPTTLPEGQTVKVLDDLLGGDWWKDQLAKKVVNETIVAQVDPEVCGHLSWISDRVTR